MMTNCTLTEIPTALLVTADAASTGLARDVGPAMYLSFVTRQKADLRKYFCGLHFEQTSVLASLLKVIWLHFE